MKFKAWDPKRRHFSSQFSFKQVQRGIFIDSLHPFDLSKCIILRFAELYDVHKREIWEGDIIEVPLYYRHDVDAGNFNQPMDSWTDIVIFKEGRFTIRNPEFSSALLSQNHVIKSRVRVVGNNFENSDLVGINLNNIKI